MRKVSYRQLVGFEHVHLENSFVLDIQASPGRLRLDVEVVLAPGHPDHRPPAPDELNCYARATIDFPNLRTLTWTGQGTPPAVDASGETDYGGIDTFFWDGTSFHLEGDWGVIDLVSAPPVIHLGPERGGK